MSDTQRPPDGAAELRTVAMPADTNPYGDIFGGWLLSQMDVAGRYARDGGHRRARRDGGRRGDELPPPRLRRRPS